MLRQIFCLIGDILLDANMFYSKQKTEGNMNITEVKKKATWLKILTFFERFYDLAKTFSAEITAFLTGFCFDFAVLGETRIFGLGLLCACHKYPREIKTRISVFLGVSFGTLFFDNGVFVFLAALTAEAASYVLQKRSNTTIVEKIIPPLCASLWFIPVSAAAFVTAVVGILALSLSFSGLFYKSGTVSSAASDCGFLCLSLAVALILSDLEFGILSFGIIAAVFFSLEGGCRGGYFLGALSGFFSGMALDTDLIIPLVISGFVCGFYIKKKRSVGIFLFSVPWVPYLFETSRESVNWNTVASLLWGVLLWCAISGIYLDKNRIVLPQNFQKVLTNKNKKVSEAIRSVSMTLSGISKAKRREREERIKTVVDGIFCAECETCTGCIVPTEQLKKRFCQSILKNKKIISSDFSEKFKENCNRWKFIQEKINETIEENSYKTSLRIDTLAEDYMAMSRILSFGEKCAENRCYHDTVAANKLKMALELKNIRTQRVDISGTRLPSVEIFGIPFKIPFPEKIIKSETEKVLGRCIEQTFFESEGKVAKIGFKALCSLNIDFYKISIPKKGEIICGDSVSAFESDDGYFYSIVSDGMGSGRDAAVCSRLGTVFLEKLISAGIDKACAVSMLGNVIASSEDEIFTTIDLLEVDLVRGKLTAIKAGAAPTWVLRNKRAYSVSSKTLPCGIISSSSAEQTVLDCYAGDTIIMASDGGESAVMKALLGIVNENRSLSSKEIAFILSDIATKECGRNDDISFCVVNIL